jgi:hypothetical protein
MRHRLTVSVLAFILLLLLLLTGCSGDQGHYAVVYPYTVTVEGQEFTFLGVRPVFGYTVADANGHEYSYRRFTSDPYRVIEITYPGNVKYIWKQHMEHEEISFGDYSAPFDLSGYAPGPVLVEAIQFPAKMEYVPPQEKPKAEKSFPWDGLVFSFFGFVLLVLPPELILTRRWHRYWYKDPTPTEFAVRMVRICGVCCLGYGVFCWLTVLFF